MTKKGFGFVGCLLQATLAVCITGAIIVGVIGWQAAKEGLRLNRLTAKSVRQHEALASAPTYTPMPFPTPNKTTPPTATPSPTATTLVIPWPTKKAPTPAADGTTPTLAAEPLSQEPASPAATGPPSPPAATAIPAPQVSESNINSSPIYAGSPLPERPATRLVIPALNLDREVIASPIVNQTWQVDHLDQAVGHLEGTASPGDASNVVLAGHVTLAPDGRAGPFKELDRLQAGEVIVVYEGDKPYYYVVDAVNVVEPTDVQVTFPSSTAQLTLITCVNYDRSQGGYADRLVAVAHLMESQN